MAQERIVIDIVNSSVQRLERLNLETWKLEQVNPRKVSWWTKFIRKLFARKAVEL